MRTLLSSHRARFWTAAFTGGTVLLGAALSARRVATDRKADRLGQEIFAPSTTHEEVFSPDLVAALPEPARRYLRHAIAPGTPLFPAVRLQMDGTMTPNPGSPPVTLTAEEILAPRRGFIWTAHARMSGLPVRVRDHYFENDGGIHVDILGLIPMPLGSGEDVTRSSRGRLIAEAVWCPTALLSLDVKWEPIDDNRARFTLAVDGEAVSVTVYVAPDGALRDVTLERWGDVGVPSPRLLPYGFAVEEEATFDGITIPTRLRGGWYHGTDQFDPATAATFLIRSARFADKP